MNLCKKKPAILTENITLLICILTSNDSIKIPQKKKHNNIPSLISNVAHYDAILTIKLSFSLPFFPQIIPQKWVNCSMFQNGASLGSNFVM